MKEMRKKVRKVANENFTNRITKWNSKEGLKDAVSLFYKEHGKGAENRHFAIRRNNQTKKYAIFIKKENKLRRLKEEDVIEKLDAKNLLSYIFMKKREGISIFKTLGYIK